MLYLEESVGFEFDEKVIDRIDTVQQLVSYIREHRIQPGVAVQTA
jgi:acyl carrier protein